MIRDLRLIAQARIDGTQIERSPLTAKEFAPELDVSPLTAEPIGPFSASERNVQRLT